MTVAFGEHTLNVGAGLVTVRVLVCGVQILESVLLVSLQAPTQKEIAGFNLETENHSELVYRKDMLLAGSLVW